MLIDLRPWMLYRDFLRLGSLGGLSDGKRGGARHGRNVLGLDDDLDDIGTTLCHAFFTAVATKAEGFRTLSPSFAFLKIFMMMALLASTSCWARRNSA